MTRDAFLRLLNEFFECVLGPVLEQKGEVLRFIGEAALAIFPVGANAGEACRRALEAAKQAVSRMRKLNETRSQPLRFGIGLHLGDVMYGNIGTPSRIESKCKELGSDLIVSAPVARELGGGLRSLGAHRLRGVGAPIELFTV